MDDGTDVGALHDVTPVFMVTRDELLPTGERWANVNPADWQPLEDSVEVTVAALTTPIKQAREDWRSVAGSWQYLNDVDDMRYRNEHPVSVAVREVAKTAGYSGAVSLGVPEFVGENEGIFEYRYPATFDSHVFADHTMVVAVILSALPQPPQWDA